LSTAPEPPGCRRFADCGQPVRNRVYSSSSGLELHEDRSFGIVGPRLFYSIRIDAYAPPIAHAWFVPGVELEDHSYPTGNPAFQWAGPRRLEVVVSTRALTGSLTTHVGDDLTLVRTIKPESVTLFAITDPIKVLRRRLILSWGASSIGRRQLLFPPGGPIAAGQSMFRARNESSQGIHSDLWNAGSSDWSKDSTVSAAMGFVR
jgi:hypothetical protein